MGYIKLVKNKAFYKRYTVKWRRRRNFQTNYRLRRRLISQDKRKYNTPKWRLVVRITNRDVIAQITSAKMIGDHILCSAYSHELKRYGLKLGLTNFSACYATGLLIARRILKKLKLDQYYPGKKHIDGNRFKSTLENVKWKPDDKICRPFKCILDKGLSRCSSGARVFAVMKGAIDGGLNIPHKVNRFPGFTKGKEEEKDSFDPEQLAGRIYGDHVSKYMAFLKEKNPDKYQRHFSQYIKEGIEPEKVREMYENVHKAIRKDPSAPPKTKKDWKQMNVRHPLPKWTKEQKTKQKLERLELRRKQDQPKKEEIKVDG